MRSVWVLLLVLPAVLAAPPRPVQYDCVRNVSAPSSLNLFPQPYRVANGSDVSASQSVVQFSDIFAVQYFTTAKVVKNLRTNTTYVLSQCGVPNDGEALAAAGPNATVFQIPLTALAAPDSTVNGFLDRLGVLDRVAYGQLFAVNPCITQLANQCNRVSSTNLTSSSIDAVFQATGPGSASYPRDVVVAWTTTSDSSAIARFEWIKYVAPFFNKEVQANQIFEQELSQFNALKVNPGSDAKVVAWINNNFYNSSSFSIWQLTLSLAYYKADLVTNAGGRVQNATVVASGVPNVTVSSSVTGDNVAADVINGFGGDFAAAAAAFKKLLQDVDIVIDETYAAVPSNYAFQTFLQKFNFSAEDIPSFKFLANNAVWRYDKAVSADNNYDWFEGALAKPSALLADFVTAITPSKAPASHNTFWLRNIAKNESTVVMDPNGCLVSLCPNKQLSPPRPICPNEYTACNGSLVYRAPGDTNCTVLDCSNVTTTAQHSGAPSHNAFTMLMLCCVLLACLFAA